MKQKILSFILLLNTLVLLLLSIKRTSTIFTQKMNYVLIGVCIIQIVLCLYHVFFFLNITKKDKDIL